MKNLLLHIRHLVRTHDCVTVPGIGSFIAATLPALIDEQRRLFLPPVRHISFNAEIAHNDGLLAASVARRDRISFEDATSRIEKAVEIIRHELAQARALEIHGIGTLSLSDNGNIIFTPSPNPDFVNPYAILQPVEMTLLTDETLQEPRRRHFILRIGTRAIRVAASVAIAASLGALLFVPLRDSSAIPVIKAAIWPQHDSTTETTFIEKPQPSIELIFTEAPLGGCDIINPDKNEDTTPLFGVVVGVFSDRDKAEAFVGQNAALSIHPARNGRFRVCAATATAIDECSTIAAKLRADGTWPEAWPARLR